MSIYINDELKQFQLNAGSSSYVMNVFGGYLMHLYWGNTLPEGDHSYMAGMFGRSSFEACEEGAWYSPNTIRQEFPCTGGAGVRKTAIEVINADGSDIVDLRYDSYRLHAGKPRIEGLPATYTDREEDAETLEIILKDSISNLEVSLFYSVIRGLNAICRWAEIKNNGTKPVFLKRFMSACVDFDRRDFQMITNFGGWATERQIEKHPLFSGVQGIYSRRGSSSHAHNPFLILEGEHADEFQGEVYGMVLAYSGSHEMIADVDSYGQTRLLAGINPEGFLWKLEPGAKFSAPEAELVYTANGLNGLSGTYHKLFRDHMCRGKFRNARRPVLLNTWEACYMDINEDIIGEIAEEAAKLGVELLVVDDGWFGVRNSDQCSLGDWYPNPEKLPNGIAGLAKRVNDAGCKLGIWFEPEMISRNSELFRNHPDWTLMIEGRPISQGRNQFLLDMSRQDVQDYLYDCISKVIADGNISYIKWDFNRNFAEVGSRLLPADRQGEVGHRYVLGVYALMERLVTAYPDVLFESCSGGGGRFDAGMLYYMPQTWASDNTDAIMRLSIQYGTSLVYPLSSISAHVSVCPNHQTGRTVSFQTRRDIAFTGAFGFELNPLRLSEEDREQMKQISADYKVYGDLFVNGDFYRLANLNDDPYAAWMYVRPDASEAFVVYATTDGSIEGPSRRVRVVGLDADAVYTDMVTGREFQGAQIMHYGLPIGCVPYERWTNIWYLKRK